MFSITVSLCVRSSPRVRVILNNIKRRILWTIFQIYSAHRFWLQIWLWKIKTHIVLSTLEFRTCCKILKSQTRLDSSITGKLKFWLKSNAQSWIQCKFTLFIFAKRNCFKILGLNTDFGWICGGSKSCEVLHFTLVQRSKQKAKNETDDKILATKYLATCGDPLHMICLIKVKTSKN